MYPASKAVLLNYNHSHNILVNDVENGWEWQTNRKTGRQTDRQNWPPQYNWQVRKLYGKM